MNNDDFYQTLCEHRYCENDESNIEPLNTIDQAFRFMPSLKSLLERYLTIRKVRITEQDVILEKLADHINLLPEIGWEVPVHYRVSIFDCLQGLLRHDANPVAKPFFKHNFSNTLPSHDSTSSGGHKFFSLLWRNQILQNSWTELKELQIVSGLPYFTVLHRRYQDFALPSDHLMSDLLDQFKDAQSKRSFRVFLYRAQLSFAKFIVEQAARTIYMPNRRLIQNELHELGLSCYWDQLEFDLTQNDKFKAKFQPVSSQ